MRHQMNKAEEQYEIRRGRCFAQAELMAFAQNVTKRHFLESIKDELEHTEIANSKKKKDEFLKGISDFYSEILRSIYGGTIKDWPSFVEYMTGEDYEEKPKCEYCNDTKEVPAPHYSKGGEIPDSDTIVCKKCNGSGHKDE